MIDNVLSMSNVLPDDVYVLASNIISYSSGIDQSIQTVMSNLTKCLITKFVIVNNAD